MKKTTRIVMLFMICFFLSSLPVFAGQITEKTIVALGADLNSDQRLIVLNLMGISEKQLQNCEVITITNNVEHQYLDTYIDPSVIGTNSLSSVIITPREVGYGVVVSTQNINYCTTGMYRNALLTAGVTDADIVVVGPSEISGTAALIGAIKAYEIASGLNISDTTMDAALNELIATGEIVNKSASSEEIEGLIAYIKAKLAAGELDNKESILNAIDEGEQKFQVTLAEEEKQKIVEFMMKIKKLGLDPNKLLEQASDLYGKFGDDLFEKVNDEGFWISIGSFFENIGNATTNFFNDLF